MRKLILTSFQSPGDVVMLTAAVRELHLANPGQFQTDVRTAAQALWDHNPYLTPLEEGAPGVEVLPMHYPAIHSANDRPYHFIHGYTQYLEQQLGLKIPVSRFYGDIYLSTEEKRLGPPGREQGVPDRFWIVIAGGKYDFTAKWWNPDSFQQVVDHFQGQLPFVQCGEEGHWHPRLKGVVDLVGKTSLREFVRLMHYAEGVVCPVTFAMHLAAAVEGKDGSRGTRPCVVIGGGREPAHWETYPHHQYLSTSGMLSCCRQGGCWKSRCQLVGDGDTKDRHDLCEQPVQVGANLRIPRCMEMIQPEDVIRKINLHLSGDVLSTKTSTVAPRRSCCGGATVKTPASKRISVSFYHGLGDCAYFAHVMPLYTKRGYEVAVECTADKAVLFRAAGATVLDSGQAQHRHEWGYPSGHTHEGQGHFWQGSKIGHNLSQHPLPDIGSKEALWEELCSTRIDPEPYLSRQAIQTAERWLSRLPRPVTLLHTKGNSGQERKSLPDKIAAEFYREFLDQCDGSLVLLDWDNRVPRLDSYRIRHLSTLGSCSTETLLALQNLADLMIGVDSGPLHTARFSKTPTIGLWTLGHYPATYTLPRPEQLNVVLADHTAQWNKWKRVPWNIVEHPGGTYDARTLARFAQQMLGAPRYLSRQQIAADVQLQQFVERCRGVQGNSIAGYCDRNRSFDVLLREMTGRFHQPTVVETGCIRSEEDWPGAGFFTYLMGAYLARHGGRLFSVDLDPRHVEFARTWTRVFGDTVRVSAGDSVNYLSRFQERIDVLYLDSLDTTEPGHQEHGLREAQVALPHLHEHSLIVFDDTPWSGSEWVGKGGHAVPWLLEKGWRVLYAGYQVVLHRSRS